MQIELHIGSLITGAVVGAVMSALGVTVIGPALFSREAPGTVDNTVLMAGLDRCRDRQPLYVTRIGEITSVKCNGHKEGVGQ